MRGLLRKTILITLAVISVFSIAIAVLVASVYTDSFSTVARHFLIQTANRTLDADLYIRKVTISFSGAIRLDQIVLQRSGKKLGSAESIELKPRMSTLLFNRIDIRNIEIVQPVLFVRSDSSGKLELETLVKPDHAQTGTGRKLAERWHFQVSSLNFEDGTVIVSDRERSYLFESIHLSGELGGQIKNPSLTIRTLSARCPELDIVLKEGSAEFRFESSEDLKISTVRLRTNRSYIQGHGKYQASRNLFQLVVDSSRISLTEVRSVYPIGLESIREIDVSGTLTLESQSFSGSDLVLSSSAGRVSGDVLARWGPSRRVSIRSEIENLDLASLFGLPVRATANGKVQIDTDDWNFRHSTGQSKLELISCRIDRFKLSAVSSQLSFSSGRIGIDRLNLMSDAGQVDLEGWFLAETGDFQINAGFSGLNPGKLLNNSSLSGNINLNATFGGRAFPPAFVDLAVVADKSQLMDKEVNRIDVTARLSGDSLRVSKGNFDLPFGTILLSGDFNLSSGFVDAFYDIKIKNAPLALDFLAIRDSLPPLEMSFAIAGRLAGHPKALKIDGTGNLADLETENISIEELTFKYRFDRFNVDLPFTRLLGDSALFTQFDSEARNIFLAKSLRFSSANLAVRKKRKQTSIDLNLAEHKSNTIGRFSGSLIFEDKTSGRFDLDLLRLEKPILPASLDRVAQPGIVWLNEKPASLYFDLDQASYSIDELTLLEGSNRISATGMADGSKSSFDGSFSASLNDLDPIALFLPDWKFPRISNGLTVSAAIGLMDEKLNLVAEFFAGRIELDTLRLDSLVVASAFTNLNVGEFEHILSDPGLEGSATVSCATARLGSDPVFQNIRFHTNKAGGQTSVFMGVERDNTKLAELNGSVFFETPTAGSLRIGNLFLDPVLDIFHFSRKPPSTNPNIGLTNNDDFAETAKASPWRNVDPIRVDFDLAKKQLDIRACKFETGGGTISIQGAFRPDGVQDLTLTIDDLEVQEIVRLSESPVALEGRMFLEGHLSGPFRDPQISGDWSIINGSIGGVALESIDGSLRYEDQNAALILTVYQDEVHFLELTADFPVDLSLAGTVERIPEKALDLSVYSKDIDLRILQPFVKGLFRIARGELTVDLSISGKPTQLVPSGQITLNNAEILFPGNSLNQQFTDMKATISLDADRITIEDLSVQSGKNSGSKMTARGFVDIRSVVTNFQTADLSDLPFNFQMRMTEFVPFNTKSEAHYLQTAQISGLVAISGRRITEPDVTGNVTLKDARIWVPDKVRTLEDDEVGLTSEDVFGNLIMDVRVLMPESGFNSIRSKDLRLEFFGDVTLAKPADSKKLDVGGEVFLKRGGKFTYWTLDFRIEEGKIAFKPGASVNPDIDLIATRDFRYQNGKPAVAQIVVSGTLLQPVVAIQAVEKNTGFPLESLSTADIVSSLLSGQPNTGVDASKVATQFAASTALNALLSNVAEELGFETLEISAAGTNEPSVLSLRKRVSRRVSVGVEAAVSGSGSKKYSVEFDIPADSTAWVPQTLEGNFETGTSKVDVFNLIFFWKKEY